MTNQQNNKTRGRRFFFSSKLYSCISIVPLLPFVSSEKKRGVVGASCCYGNVKVPRKQRPMCVQILSNFSLNGKNLDVSSPILYQLSLLYSPRTPEHLNVGAKLSALYSFRFDAAVEGLGRATVAPAFYAVAEGSGRNMQGRQRGGEEKRSSGAKFREIR